MLVSIYTNHFLCIHHCVEKKKEGGGRQTHVKRRRRGGVRQTQEGGGGGGGGGGGDKPMYNHLLHPFFSPLLPPHTAPISLLASVLVSCVRGLHFLFMRLTLPVYEAFTSSHPRSMMTCFTSDSSPEVSPPPPLSQPSCARWNVRGMMPRWSCSR